MIWQFGLSAPSRTATTSFGGTCWDPPRQRDGAPARSRNESRRLENVSLGPPGRARLETPERIALSRTVLQTVIRTIERGHGAGVGTRNRSSYLAETRLTLRSPAERLHPSHHLSLRVYFRFPRTTLHTPTLAFVIHRRCPVLDALTHCGTRFPSMTSSAQDLTLREFSFSSNFRPAPHLVIDLLFRVDMIDFEFSL